MKAKKDILFIPGYSVIPFIIMLGINIFTYQITPLFTDKFSHYIFATDLDAAIPFVPAFIVPYFLAYIQWVVGYIVIARVSKDYCDKVLLGEIIAKSIVCICYIVIPTTLIRPEVAGTDVFSEMVRFLYQIDSPVNLFPSIHCLESWFCFRCCVNQKSIKLPYKIGMGIMTALVFISTVCLKQHVVVDIISAIAVAEIGLALSQGILTLVNSEKRLKHEEKYLLYRH